MRILSGSPAARYVAELAGRSSRSSSIEPRVRRIVNDVRRNGDRALVRYARRFDGILKSETLRVSPAEINLAWKSVDPHFKSSLQTAAANIGQFCEWQKPVEWTRTRKGALVGQLVRPLDSVGCYVPAGRHPLVSTLLMTAIPAQVAGVKTIRVCSPQPRRELLAAAAMLGISEVYRVGGAHAIAALAYGTESILPVEKIVGPGNSYVTTAKKLVSFDCSIDMLAGPTETVVYSERGQPHFIAADLVAQAEHDPEALAIFITTRVQLAKAVAKSVEERTAGNQIAFESLRKSGAVLIGQSRHQAVEWLNQIAPEHLTIDGPELPLIRNAGSVFIGNYSPQPAGDYATGPNHVLPTGGAARFRGGLSVLDFVKIITVQKLSRPALREMSPVITTLAEVEGLLAHADSIRVRCRNA